MAGLLILAAVAFVHARLALKAGFFNINDAYFVGQDAVVLALFFLIWLTAATPLGGRAAALTDLAFRLARKADRRLAIAIALATGVAVAAGATLIIHGVRLSGDEYFADFDARIFAAGRLTAPIPPEWRPYARALQPIFVSVTPDGTAWSSVYLPLDAALRSVFIRLGQPSFTGALLAGAAILLVWRLARKLWPGRPDAALLSAALLALSPQFLATAMTPYAMTADLAFELAWLNLFLSRRPVAQGLAGVTAFAACGLHKWLFAPLFAAPFLVWAWREGRRGAAAAAAMVFAASIAFWIAWPSLESFILGTPPSLAGIVEITQVVGRAGWTVNSQIMAENVIRFAAWQSPAALPMALLGVWFAFRRPFGVTTALAAGPLIAIGLLTFVLPFQGHGWGYRYLHPWLGSLSLLAAAAWVRMAPDTKRAAEAARPILATTLLGALIVLPIQAVMVRGDLVRFAALSKAIARSPADVVLVDTQSDPFGVDLVRNDPFLARRPKVMEADLLTAGQITALAARHSLALFTLRGDAVCFAPIVTGRIQTVSAETCRPMPG